MSTIASAALALAMISALILFVGGVRVARRREDRQRGLLMVAAAIVLLANVLIWTV